MKKLLLTLSLGALAIAGANADDYTVYNNGVLNSQLHVYGWWNDSANFQATNPSGDGQVWEFKAADGGAAASMGLNMEAPQNTGILHAATLNFSWYATTTATYTVRLTSVKEEDYKFTVTTDQLNKWNTTSLSVVEYFPTVATQWDNNTNLGVGYVFSIILDGGEASTVLYLNDIYYSNVDNSWVAPVVTIPEPKDVPTPSFDKENIMSFYGYYGNANFNIGGWGQSTQVSSVEIEGQQVMMLRNFNYLGLVDFNINISDYDYMHVDYWTPNEGTNFGYVPISLNPTVDTPIWMAPEIKVSEWNSYDAPLSSFGADMSKIEQLKFVANEPGSTEFAYIANIYFYKDSSSENPGGGDDNPGEGDDTPSEGATYKDTVSGSYTQTMSADDVKTYPYNLEYQIVYNENKTLSIIASYDWLDGNPVGAGDGLMAVIPGLWTYTTATQGVEFTSDATFEPNTTVEITFQTAVALGNVETKVNYVVGSSNVTSAVAGVAAENANVDIYTLSGVRVAKSVNFNEVKSSLNPGLYIVGGKKVIVK